MTLAITLFILAVGVSALVVAGLVAAMDLQDGCCTHDCDQGRRCPNRK